MADTLPSIGGDSGPVEATPVVLFNSSGVEITNFGSGGSDTVTAGNIGATNESVAATPGATSGLHGLIAGFWTAFLSLIGSLTETAPATDTASSGLSGRLQRIAQRLTSLITYFGTTADAKSTATDTTAVSAMSVWKEISYSTQATVTAITSGTQAAGQLTAAASTSVINASDSPAGPATSTSRIVSCAGDTNATSAKASAGTLKSVFGYNAAASIRYLKFYNKASAPTVGTDTPVLTLAMPPGGFAYDWPAGRSFATGIAYGITTAVADNSTAAPTAADIVALNVEYI